MEAKLTKLYNTLSQIETKGENTKIMGICLQFIEQLVSEVRAEEEAKKAPKAAKAPKSKSE